MSITDAISLFALFLSIVALFLTLRQNRRLAKDSLRYQTAAVYLQRNLDTFVHLADWPDAFDLFGIDLQKAEEEGVSKGHIVYLIISLNAMRSVCLAENTSPYDHLKENVYRQNMFDNEITRRAWKYAQKALGDTAPSVNKYLEEKYRDEFPGKNNEG